MLSKSATPKEPSASGESELHHTSVLFLCPFDLSRYRGTALRASIAIETVRTAIQHRVICSGGGGDGTRVLDTAWRGKARWLAHLRPLRFCFLAAPYVLQEVPRIIHTFDVMSALPAILWWRPKLGSRIIVELHGLLSAEMGGGGPMARSLMRGVERYVLRRADGIIAMSYSQRDHLLKVFGIDGDKVRVMWGPVDLDVFRYRDPEESQYLRVGYSGNDFPWQGVDDCIAAATLLAREPTVEFLFVTGSNWRTNVTDLPRATCVPSVSREQTAEALSRCHVLLSPRKGRAANLQYPFKLSSYLAVGRPIIVTDVSDQRRIVEAADCGLVIPPDSPEDMAEAVLMLKSHGQKARMDMGRRARRFAENHFSLAQFREALLSLYKDVEG